MGTKRVGLARMQALLENLKRSLTLGTATISAASLTATTGGVTVTAGGITHTAGSLTNGRAANVAAAGNAIGNAAQLSATHPVQVCTTDSNLKGVKLPAVGALDLGVTVKIYNFSASNTLEVYPTANDRIYPAADDVAITVAAMGFLEVMVIDATGWVGTEGVITV